MPTLHNHTQHFRSFRDCQAVPANAQTQAWQRVCLSKCSTEPQENRADEKEARCPNITYMQAGVSCFVGQESGKFRVQFFLGSSVVKIPA